MNQFGSYLMKSTKLSPHQSGNKKHHSCETLNLLTGDTILKAMVTALILLDLSKAFDSVNHALLLEKLGNVGASPSVVKWSESYLTGRTQSVRIGSTLSTSLPVSYGVPQGAILSPLLFSIDRSLYLSLKVLYSKHTFEFTSLYVLKLTAIYSENYTINRQYLYNRLL